MRQRETTHISLGLLGGTDINQQAHTVSLTHVSGPHQRRVSDLRVSSRVPPPHTTANTIAIAIAHNMVRFRIIESDAHMNHAAITQRPATHSFDRGLLFGPGIQQHAYTVKIAKGSGLKQRRLSSLRVSTIAIARTST